eukprot:386783-Karenia_brevis.AAC.1
MAKFGSNLTLSWQHHRPKMAHVSSKNPHQSPPEFKPGPFRLWSDQMVRKYEIRFCLGSPLFQCEQRK